MASFEIIMNDLLNSSNLPEHIIPEFAGNSNTEFVLYEGEIKVQGDNDQNFIGKGKFHLSWFSQPEIAFDVRLTNLSDDLLRQRDIVFKINRKENDELLEGRIKKISIGSQGESTIEGHVKKHNIVEEQKVAKVKFYLCNFLDYLGNSVKENKGQKKPHITLEDGEWVINIDALKLEHEITPDLLKKEGKYTFTHVATVERKDGNLFALKQTELVLSALNYFLSFLTGQWVSPYLLTGYDDNQSKCWIKWTNFQTGASQFGYEYKYSMIF